MRFPNRMAKKCSSIRLSTRNDFSHHQAAALFFVRLPCVQEMPRARRYSRRSNRIRKRHGRERTFDGFHRLPRNRRRRCIRSKRIRQALTSTYLYRANTKKKTQNTRMRAHAKLYPCPETMPNRAAAVSSAMKA